MTTEIQAANFSKFFLVRSSICREREFGHENRLSKICIEVIIVLFTKKKKFSVYVLVMLVLAVGSCTDDQFVGRIQF